MEKRWSLRYPEIRMRMCLHPLEPTALKRRLRTMPQNLPQRVNPLDRPILAIAQPTLLISVSMPLQISGSFQLLQPGQDTIFTLFGDGSKTAHRVTPVLWKTQEHRQDSFGFEGNRAVSEVVIAHGGIVGVLFYTENRDRQHLLPTQRQSGIYADSRMRLARRMNRSLPLGVIRVWWAICPYP